MNAFVAASSQSNPQRNRPDNTRGQSAQPSPEVVARSIAQSLIRPNEPRVSNIIHALVKIENKNYSK